MSDTTNGDNGKGRGKGSRGRGPSNGGARGGPRGGGERRGSRPMGTGGGERGEARSFRPRTKSGDESREPRSGDRNRSSFSGPRSERPDGEGKRSFAKRPPRREAEGRPDPRSESGGERKSFRPFRSRQNEEGASQGERKSFRPRSSEGESRDRGERPRPFKERSPRREIEGSERRHGARGTDDASADRKPFAPRSRGMMSHGGARDGDAPRRPKSYGRLRHENSDGERETRRPRADAPRKADASEGETANSMRVARRLARAGIASRRDAEGMIADGRIKVNGRVIDSPALDVTTSDRIEIDGSPIPAIERTRLWLFHKLAGTVTTNRDPEGRATIFDRLPQDMPRVLTVGRLDINTEGLLLLTNDGGLARVLELPSTGWLRRYRVRAHGSITQGRLDELRQGIAIDGVFYGAIEASLDREQGSNVWLTLGLREGKNREVKRVLGHLGLEVNRLIRLSYGPFQLGELAEGAVQEIRGRTLREQLGERLIDEAGADFDAPINNIFSNSAVAAEPVAQEKAKAKSEWVSASDTAPNKKRARESKREDALGRLDTRARRPERGEGERPAKRFGGGRDDRSEKKERSFGGREERFGAKDERRERPAGRFDRPREESGGERKSAYRPAGAAKRSANVWMAPGARPQGAKKPNRADRPSDGGGKGGPSPRRPRPDKG